MVNMVRALIRMTVVRKVPVINKGGVEVKIDYICTLLYL